MSNFTKLMAQAAAGVGGGSFYDYEIENSLRSNPADLAELSRTFGTATSRTTFTISFWAKKSSAGQTLTNIMAKEVSAASEEYVGFYLDSIRVYNGATGSPGISSVEVDRDLSAWFHYLIAVDTTQATASDRIRIYKNGTEVAYGTNSNPSQNQNLTINSSGLHKITNFASTTYSDSTYRWNGYLAEFVFIDGTAYAPTDLGENKNGVWVPKDPSGLTYGNNGFWLKFDNASSLGTDSSGNGNNWTVTNYTSSDQMIDTPTNNFATLPMGSPRTGYVPTVSEGNLKYVTQNSTGTVCGTGIPRSGVWYVEWQSPNCYPGNGYRGYFGLTTVTNGDKLSSSSSYWLTQSAGKTYVGSDYINYGTGVGTGTNSLGPGDIGSLTIDMDNLEITFRLNNSVVASGVTIQDAPHTFCLLGDGTSSRPENTIFNINFGQNGDFNGYETAQGNTDENGIGDFYYAPPSGALALCTANLPEPTIGPNIGDTAVAGLPEEQFNILLYEGNSTNDRDITGVGFDPDLGIFKNRDEAYGWIIVDRNRGDGWSLGFDTGVQESGTGKFDSFITDGYRIDSHPGLNRSSIVNYSWKAGGTASSNTDGNITSNVSANTDAGISIVTYTGSSSGISVGHGLSSAPEMIIWKAQGTPNGFGRHWIVWTKDLTSTNYILYLSLSNAETNVTAGSVLSSSPTATTFSLGTEPSVNWNAENYVSYCFHSVEGFSSIGSYTGNGSDDGSFIYTGFRPAFFLIKATNTTGNWQLWDASRDSYNVMDTKLFPDLTNAEQTNSTYYIDFVSNGIKLRSNASMSNQSGINFIYMAFAENPFKYANAR
jgi:hypothetical protein